MSQQHDRSSTFDVPTALSRRAASAANRTEDTAHHAVGAIALIAVWLAVTVGLGLLSGHPAIAAMTGLLGLIAVMTARLSA